MTKIDQMLQLIQANFALGEPFTVANLRQFTELSRSMISGYLNQLCKLGHLNKTNTRPTQFWLPRQPDGFATVIGADGSLAPIIAQCKAAVNYPPNGLPVIIQGHSGVGKSFLAQKIYEYARFQNVIKSDAPLITLNCADYANNPELLSSVLFGYVKGAFTGADQTKKGLLDAADQGFLFLDEVHNLSQENQEKLFLLIDQNKFYRLGEDNEWHRASIRLILATTADLKTALLTTFRRRIPLAVTLPDFAARRRQERIQLIDTFFQAEAQKLHCQIKVATTFWDELLQSHDEGNIGTLQNKIKVSCAQAYTQQLGATTLAIPALQAADYLVLSPDKPAEKTLTSTKLTELWQANFGDLTEKTVKKNLNFFLADLKKMVPSDDLTDSLIWHHFQTNQELLAFFGMHFNANNLKDLTLLSEVFSNYHYPQSFEFATKNNFKYRRVAAKILEIAQVDPNNPGLISLIIAYLKVNLQITAQRNALILMHGRQSATSLASEANQLVGDYVFTAIDMPIKVKTQAIVQKVKEYSKQMDTQNGLILLVDMGSLEKMYREIKDNVKGDLLILNNVSTQLALQVGFALKQNQPMAYFTHLDCTPFQVKSQYFEGIAQMQNIVISCMSGQGVAEKIAEILTQFVPQSPVEILTMDYDRLKKLKEMNLPNTFKNTFGIIATEQISIPEVACINIEKVVNGSQTLACLKPLYTPQQLKQFTNELIKLFSLEGASSRLKFLNPDKVINEISDLITALEQQYHVVFKNFIRINLYLHLSSMIERLLTGDINDQPPLKNDQAFKDFVQVGEQIFKPLKEKYNIKIPLREYEYVYHIITAPIDE